MAAKRKDVGALARAARAAGPAALAASWERLSPLERVASFRALPARAAAVLFEALPPERRWLAYLGCVSEGAAPLLEGKPEAARRALRRPGRAELARMREALA